LSGAGRALDSTLLARPHAAPLAVSAGRCFESSHALHRSHAALRALPFQTIGDIARHGLELHVYCSRCFATRLVSADDTRWRDRLFATACFRCTGQRYTGRPCGGPGVPKIRPPELLRVGGPVTLAFLWCNSCIWEIDRAQLDKPPWSGRGQRYQCPGCLGRVEWHIHGPAWRPGGLSSTATASLACGLPRI
jgi:hypothetical protein